MFLLVIRKMLNNKWMVMCLLIGSILAVAMVSSIPMYTDAILQRLLIKDMERYQSGYNVYPGRYLISGEFLRTYGTTVRYSAFQSMDAKAREYFDELNVPHIRQLTEMRADNFNFQPVTEPDQNKTKTIGFISSSGIEDHIKLEAGRMPAAEPVDGVYEVLVTAPTLRLKDVELEELYRMRDPWQRTDQEIQFRIVGVFTMENTQDTYWIEGGSTFAGMLLINHDLMLRDFVEPNERFASSLITSARWYTAMDYHTFTLEDIEYLASRISDQTGWMDRNSTMGYDIPMMSMLIGYVTRASQLRTTLWVIQAPILIMLAFYTFMVSQLIIDYERNEVAVFKSRGASDRQVLLEYLIQNLIINGFALIIGPLLGLQICKLIGSANGFLEMVQRTALTVTLRPNVYLYALGTLALSLVTMLLPVMIATRSSIVEFKQLKRRKRGSFWKRYMLDVLCLGLSALGYFSFTRNQEWLAGLGGGVTDAPVDPLLFISSTLFILGLGLLLLRIYPYIIRLIYLIGKRFWSPVLYASFLEVSRSRGMEQFLILFLILTLAVGLFDANSARTINQNMEDRIHYNVGADIVIRPNWPTVGVWLPADPNNPSGPLAPVGNVYAYVEPPYEDTYADLDGTVESAKVLVIDHRINGIQAVARPVAGSNFKYAYLMAIDPYSFGKVAWFNQSFWNEGGLKRAHWNTYLNGMSENPSFALVSSTYKSIGVERGDVLSIGWRAQDQRPIEVVVYDFIDYWPGINPQFKHEDSTRTSTKDFIVTNLNYVQSLMSTPPYEVWYKRAEDSTEQQIYEAISERNLALMEENPIVNATRQIIDEKNDPLLQGTNGATTMSFIITMLVSGIGFIIYWILSIKSRVLQFGILRAMGMRMREVFGILVCEQILISGVAIFLGIMVGSFASQLFVPLFQVTFSAGGQVPPFRVVTLAEDYLKVYIFVAALLVIGFATLGAIVKRIKITQALKLGED